jgi:hypothetical protein
MSTLRTNNVQVGQSATATNNFTLYQPSVPDGTVRLGVGNTGATTLDAVTVTSAGNVAVPSLTVNSNNISAVNSLGFRNRIINGNMVIDQRNAGASVSIPANDARYVLDRWYAGNNADSVISVVRDTVAPDGYANSHKVTVTTADASIGATQNAYVAQWVEGLNTMDLAWGTAAARSVTLSFWVRSSVSGTFGGAITNSAINRSYPFTYVINATNTWEYKTVSLAGDTTGTWLNDTSIGIRVFFALGTGSTLAGPAGAWAGTEYRGATGQTNLISTLNATWFLTGVQLEAGTVASPFERRDYGRELIMCQRYLPAFNGANNYFSSQVTSTTVAYTQVTFPVTARVAPTGISTSAVSGSNFLTYNSTGSGLNTTAITFVLASTNSALIATTVASGLTAGNASSFLINTSNGQILFTGCEL